MAVNGAEQGLLLKVMLVDSLFESLDLVITQNFPSTIFRLNELLAAPMFNNPMFADEPPGCRLPPELKWAQTCRLQPVVALTAETTRVINCLFGYCSIVEELVEGMKKEVEQRGYADVRTHNEILSLLRAIQSATPLYYELMNIYNRTRQKLTDLMAESPGHKKHYLCRIYHTDKTEYQALCNIVWRVRNDFSAIQNMVLEHWDDLKPTD